MIARRDLIMGGACFAAAGAAYALKPRNEMSLQGDLKLDQIVPAEFAGWRSNNVTDLVAPKEEGSLASRLYGDTLGRVYVPTTPSLQVMMLLAHGDTQSNSLQLHRPEACYPAFGFAITHSVVAELPLAEGVTLPVRRLIAVAPDRVENIVYWARLGEYLPTSGMEQRINRLQTSMKGLIADGLLARFSVVSDESDRAFGDLDGFLRSWVRALPSAHRAALIGTLRARAIG